MYENIFESFAEIHGILAAPPCTDFAVSGAKHWKAKANPMPQLFETINRLEYFTELVYQVLRIVDLCQPRFYAIENPVGRIKKLVPEIGEAWFFQPYWYGDNYSKKTGLYGKFNKPKPTNIVDPIKHSYGSKTQEYGGKSEKTKELRSITPLGFAYAFYEANNLKDLYMKKFLWKDKTGRGFTNTIDFDKLIDYDEVNYSGDNLVEWAESAEIGEEFENSTMKFTRIE
jgi:site-specific DNA-cytosine methylase